MTNTEPIDNILKEEKNEIDGKVDEIDGEVTDGKPTFKHKYNSYKDDNLKKFRKYDGNDDNDDGIYEILIKEEVNENDKISARYQNCSLKVEIKDENKNGNVDNVVFLDKRPLHPHGRLRRRTKDNNDVLFLDKQPLHPHHRLKQKAKKLELDVETLTEIPFVKIDIPLHTKESSVRENKFIDHIIKNLPADNDK